MKTIATTSKTNWQTLLAQSTKTWAGICQRLALPETMFNQHAHQAFPMRVTERYLAKIKPSDPNDPLLLQILPTSPEMAPQPNMQDNPLQENRYNPVPGLLHKYHGRVLVMFSNACAIHCRYCFRRTFNYQDNTPGRAGLEKIIHYISTHQDIHEVILSGGDPLTVPDTVLQRFVLQLEAIPHVQTLRIHSRIPVILPERITASLLAWFCQTRLKPVLVIHTNHPQELDADIFTALNRLQQHGVVILNQSVLLKGVNDQVQILAELSHSLFRHGVLPYYLHQLDPVTGAEHFQVSKTKAKQIMTALASQCPGYLVPKWVQEIPGEKNKTWLAWNSS